MSSIAGSAEIDQSLLMMNPRHLQALVLQAASTKRLKVAGTMGGVYT
jgi:hypothetical protein